MQTQKMFHLSSKRERERGASQCKEAAGCHDPNFLCNSCKLLPKVAANLQPFLAFSNKLPFATIISGTRQE